jgi:hypothetical protein
MCFRVSCRASFSLHILLLVSKYEKVVYIQKEEEEDFNT